MSDLVRVADRKKSFYVIHSSVISEKEKQWKEMFGPILPMIDLVSSSHSETYNEVLKLGIPLYYNEMIYYDQVFSGVDNENLQVVDLSFDNCENHINSLKNSGVYHIAIETMIDARLLTNAIPNSHLILRVSANNEVYDIGCTRKEVLSILSTAKEENIPILSLCFYCHKAEDVKSLLEIVNTIFVAASNNQITINTLYIIGEGIQQLARLADDESMSTLTELKELAGRLVVKVDASRFFFEHAYTIYTHIIGKKVKVMELGRRVLYFTDNGVYCSFFNAHINHENIDPQPVFVQRPDDDHSATYGSTVFGPTCDSIDNLGDGFNLPELEVGDWLRYEGNGYRCSNYSARFNGFEDPDIIIE